MKTRIMSLRALPSLILAFAFIASAPAAPKTPTFRQHRRRARSHKKAQAEFIFGPSSFSMDA